MTNPKLSLPDTEARSLQPAQAGIDLETREEGSPILRGYGAVFYQRGKPETEFRLGDLFVERIAPGAFDRAIREDDVRCLYNHDPAMLLGRSTAGTLRLSTDAVGLRYEVDLPDTNAGRDVAESAQRGDLSGASIIFRATAIMWKEEEDEELPIREITEVRLFDCGPVPFPAYEGTSAEIAKRSLQEWQASRIPKHRHQVTRRRRRLENQ